MSLFAPVMEGIGDAGYCCGVCGGWVFPNSYHGCGGTPTYPVWQFGVKDPCPRCHWMPCCCPVWPAPLPTEQLCPVCLGRGQVQEGFYSGLLGTGTEECHRCGGRGTFWPGSAPALTVKVTKGK